MVGLGAVLAALEAGWAAGKVEESLAMEAAR